MRLTVLERGFAVLLFGFGAYITAQAMAYGIIGSTVTGTGFFPFLSGLLLLGASGTIIAGHLRRTRQSDEVLEWRPMLPVLVIVGITVLFLLLVETVGMVALTPLYIGAVTAVIERPRGAAGWVRLLAVAIGFTLFAWLLFRHTLRIPLPAGIF